MPTLPNISQGQMALDPVNQIIYYKTESNELKSVTLKWLQESSDTIDTTDSVTVGGDFVITGNLTVNGTTVTLNTESILVEDNFLVLNSNVTGTPSTNSGLEIERGTSPNVIIRWNEGSDRWEFPDTDSS
jgi:outer membrane protein assembly factor BamB